MCMNDSIVFGLPYGIGFMFIIGYGCILMIMQVV